MNWRDQAACKGLTALMYPDSGGNASAAKAVCAECPMTAECLEYALDNHEHFGIWGGTSEKERRTMRKGRSNYPANRQRVAQCGTASGYTRHRRAGEPSCRRCREAKAAYVRERKLAAAGYNPAAPFASLVLAVDELFKARTVEQLQRVRPNQGDAA